MYKNFIIILFLTNNIIAIINKTNTHKSQNSSLNKFLSNIKISQFTYNIRIVNIDNQLIIFNGTNTVGYYDGKQYEIFNFIINTNSNLVDIKANDSYILLLFNNNISQIVIYDKIKKTINIMNFHHMLCQLILMEKFFIVVDLFNHMHSYSLKNNALLWKQEYPYSKLLFNKNQLKYLNNKLFWMFNSYTLHITDPDSGNIEDSIIVNNNQTILDVNIYDNYIILLCNNGIFFYNKLSLQLERFVKNLYPISLLLIVGDNLYFHDNQFLFLYNILEDKIEKFSFHQRSEQIRIINLIHWNNYILLNTHTNLWFMFHIPSKKIITIKNINLWSYINPIIYNNLLIYYKNFSTRFFDILSIEDILKYRK